MSLTRDRARLERALRRAYYSVLTHKKRVTTRGLRAKIEIYKIRKVTIRIWDHALKLRWVEGNPWK